MLKVSKPRKCAGVVRVPRSSLLKRMRQRGSFIGVKQEEGGPSGAGAAKSDLTVKSKKAASVPEIETKNVSGVHLESQVHVSSATKSEGGGKADRSKGVVKTVVAGKGDGAGMSKDKEKEEKAKKDKDKERERVNTSRLYALMEREREKEEREREAMLLKKAEEETLARRKEEEEAVLLKKGEQEALGRRKEEEEALHKKERNKEREKIASEEEQDVINGLAQVSQFTHISFYLSQFKYIFKYIRMRALERDNHTGVD